MVVWKRKDICLGEQNVSELTILEWKPLFSLKYFHFHKTDGDQDRFHTHAFNAVSVLLSGDYIEEVIEGDLIIPKLRSRKRFLPFTGQCTASRRSSSCSGLTGVHVRP